MHEFQANKLEIDLKGSDLAKEDALKFSIADKTGAMVKCRINISTVHLKDIDSDTTELEVLEAIIETPGESSEVRVTSMTPAYGTKRNATVKMPDKMACQAEKERRIRIGCIYCRVSIRKVDIRCNRCWEVGHWTNTCQEPDLSKACYKRKLEEHVAKQCTLKPDNFNRKRVLFGEAEDLRLQEVDVSYDTGINEAQDLIHHSVIKLGAAVVVPELNVRMTTSTPWLVDVNHCVAIKVTEYLVGITGRNGKGAGFFWIEINDVVIYECYISPNSTLGDFNAKSPLRGSKATNEKCKIVMEWISGDSLFVHNCGSEPSFVHGALCSLT
ncbi:hypothetical protein J6590_020212 [Homalodisca vitripennis]|nr:hypothetical protein J6590_020212 [Homalodisca vitripennis]